MRNKLTDGYQRGGKRSFTIHKALGGVLSAFILLLQSGCDIVSSVKSTPALGIANNSVKQDSNTSNQANSKAKKTEMFGAGYELMYFKVSKGSLPKVTIDIKFKDGKSSRQSGEPHLMTVRLCNRSTSVIYVSPTMVPQDYGVSFVARDEKGKRVRMIGVKRRLTPAPLSPLHAGKCIQKTFDLNRLFVLPKNGELTIRAFYHSNWLNKAASNVKLSSNQLKFFIRATMSPIITTTR